MHTTNPICTAFTTIDYSCIPSPLTLFRATGFFGIAGGLIPTLPTALAELLLTAAGLGLIGGGCLVCPGALSGETGDIRPSGGEPFMSSDGLCTGAGDGATCVGPAAAGVPDVGSNRGGKGGAGR
jgi:hypothetical protein